MNRIHPSVRDQLGDPTFRAELRRAEVVLGISILDPSDKRVFYGARALSNVGGDTSLLQTVEVPVDFEPPSEDAEALSSYLLMARGSTSWPETDIREDWN